MILVFTDHVFFLTAAGGGGGGEGHDLNRQFKVRLLSTSGYWIVTVCKGCSETAVRKAVLACMLRRSFQALIKEDEVHHAHVLLSYVSNTTYMKIKPFHRPEKAALNVVIAVTPYLCILPKAIAIGLCNEAFY